MWSCQPSNVPQQCYLLFDIPCAIERLQPSLKSILWVQWAFTVKVSLNETQWSYQPSSSRSQNGWEEKASCSCNLPKHLPWLNYQLRFLSLFTLYSNRPAVFTSMAIILPFTAAKRTTSIGSYKSKPIKAQPNIGTIEQTPVVVGFFVCLFFCNIQRWVDLPELVAICSLSL